MKVIDLFNKIANGEEVPEKFKFAEQVFEKHGGYIQDEDGDSIFESMFADFSNINDKVEIIEDKEKPTLNDIRESCGLPRIEDKKIEKINNAYYHESQDRINETLKNKINEIIERINNDR